MAIWMNSKKKGYASTGPTAWLKRYVEFMVERMQTEVRGKLKTFPIQPSGEEGGAVINDVVDRTYDDDGNLVAGNVATGKHALAAGTCTTANGDAAAAVGEQVIAEGDCQLVHGRYNLPDKNALHVVGNGIDEANRSNAYLLDQEGNGWFKGNVTVGEDCLELATKVWSEEVLEEELKKKVDITWIEPKNLLESVMFHEKLDVLTTEGIYGLRNGRFFYHTDYNGNPTGEVTFEPNTTSYAIVTTDKENYPCIVRQLLWDAGQGIKWRSGAISEDGTVTWEDWKEYVTTDALRDELSSENLVHTTGDEEIDGYKSFKKCPYFEKGLLADTIESYNAELKISTDDTLNLSAGVDIILSGGFGEIKVSELLENMQTLVERVTALESVNADLESIIALQESYIGGDEA